MNVNENIANIMPAINTNSTKTNTINWITSVSDDKQHTYRYFNPYPSLHKSLLTSNANKYHTLNIVHINIRSLPKHYDDLCLLPLHQFDILCLSETWLNKNHVDQSIELTFFADPIRHDRNDNNKSRGCGSLIYYKPGLQCAPLPHLESMFHPEIDSTWIKIKLEKQHKPIIIGTVYKYKYQITHKITRRHSFRPNGHSA